MLVEVTDLSQLVRARVYENFRLSFPHLDVAENSALDDLLVDPIVSILTPVIEKMNADEISDLLDNAEFVPEDELDRKLRSNYMTERRLGTKSMVPVIVSFINITPEDTVVAPKGTIFTDSTGDKKFQTITDMEFTYSDLLAGYTEGRETYEVEFYVEAVEPGKSFNVAPGTITKCQMFNSKIFKVTNKVQGFGGVDRESNTEYVERVRDFYVSRYVGTEPGYRMLLMENFPEIEDVTVQGYKDPYMKRDIVKIPSAGSEGGFKQKHIGGMVDIYVKGTRVTDLIEEIPLLTHNLFLEVDPSLVDEDSISVMNNTDKTKVPVIKSKEKDESGQGILITLSNEGNVSYDPEKVSDIYVSYKIKDARGLLVEKMEVYKVGITEAELLAPVEKLKSLSVEGTVDVATIDDNTEITEVGEKGTTNERVSVKLKGLDKYRNGTIAKLKYSMNATIANAGEVLMSVDNRLITNDLLCLEAKKQPVNMAFDVIMKFGEDLTGLRAAKIKDSIAAMMNGLRLGEHITEMQIAEYIQSDDELDFIKYVVTPFKSFYIPETFDEDIKDERENAIIHAELIEHLVLNKMRITETDLYCCERGVLDV